MRLAKLTLNGFKSFADRAEFTFDEPIIGVVGPNGCGKSNIVDAIKWVLGERSSKSLRGKEMIDVIFAGSAGRRPSGMASVMLTFENPLLDPDVEMVEIQLADVEDDLAEAEHEIETTDHRIESRKRRGLPIDTDVVEVERRLYRDGASQYLINGRRCRLKDIRNLFLDTGIGADAYSIIEQGKVDAMLLASPQERRSIFEEAAGIAKYKQRLIESQRKLDKTERNLLTTREQLQNTERRLRIVKGQAAKARRFTELDSELRALRLTLAFDQYDELRQQLDGLTSRLADLERVRVQATSKVADLEASKQEVELERHELQEEHRRLSDERTAAEHTALAARQRKEMTERSLEDLQRQADTDQKRQDELTKKMGDLTSDTEDHAESIAALVESLNDAERLLSESSETRAAVLEELAEQQASLSEKRAAATNIDRERTAILASIESEQRRIQSLREQADQLEGKRSGVEAEREELLAKADAAKAGVQSLQRRVDATTTTLEETDRSAETMSADRGTLATTVAESEQEYVRLDSRRQTLEEMIEQRAGLTDAVKDVLDKRDEGDGFAGVVAPLADLIDTGSEHAAAVEAALGPVLQALVVESLDSALADGHVESLRGRVAFLPASGHTGRGTIALDDMIRSRVTPLREVVRPSEDRFSELLDRLLGRTLLVESLDAAMMLKAGPLSDVPDARFVTRKGWVLEADGRTIVGPVGGDSSSGLLQRRTELAELEQSLEGMARNLNEQRTELEAFDAEAAALNTRRTELRTALATDQRHLVQEQTKLERHVADAERLGRELSSLAGELEQARKRADELETDRVALGEKADQLQRLQTEQASAAKGIEERIARVQARQESATDQMTAARVEVGRLTEQLGSARREQNRLQLARDHAERERRDLEQHLESTLSRRNDLKTQAGEALVQIEEAKARADQAGRDAQEAEIRAKEAMARVTEVNEQLTSARSRAQQIERDWNSLEISRREVEVKRENIEQRTSDELELDLALEYREYRDLMDSGDVLRIDRGDAESRADELRTEIKSLGNVNLDSIEEERNLAEHNEDLIRQVADIDEARTRLGELIERLNVVCKHRFEENFKSVQEEFGSPNGMFRKLFGGGRAEVRLMPLVKEVDGQKVVTDEIDVLESGIEVIAKPPGKEPRSISQLSGGEKTMTAVALLLSIFRSKPSCFCILDEVDAALDDANVDRFCNVVRQYTDTSHFIVITHNKRTMQTADRLYGVTMQERGVSKRVTVRFDQVSSDGSLAKSAVEAKPDEPVEDSEPEENGSVRPSGVLRRALAGMQAEREGSVTNGARPDDQGD